VKGVRLQPGDDQQRWAPVELDAHDVRFDDLGGWLTTVRKLSMSASRLDTGRDRQRGRRASTSLAVPATVTVPFWRGADVVWREPWLMPAL
jgi:hypothetical protein